MFKVPQGRPATTRKRDFLPQQLDFIGHSDVQVGEIFIGHSDVQVGEMQRVFACIREM